MGPQIQTGRVFGDSFRLLIGHFSTFVGAAYLVYTPLILGVLLLTLGGVGAPDDPGGMVLIQLVMVVGKLIGAPLVTAVVIRGVARHLRGEPVTFADSLSFGSGLILPVLGLSIVVGFVSGLGALLCVIPGLIIYTGWFVATPVLVVERRRVFDSLQRSWELTDGNRVRIFFVIAGLWALSFVLGMLVVAVMAGADTFQYADLVGLLIEPLTTALTGVLAAVTYFEIRRVREELDPAQLDDVAALFD